MELLPLVLSILNSWDRCWGGWVAATSLMKLMWSAIFSIVTFFTYRIKHEKPTRKWKRREKNMKTDKSLNTHLEMMKKKKSRGIWRIFHGQEAENWRVVMKTPWLGVAMIKLITNLQVLSKSIKDPIKAHVPKSKK